MSSAEIQRDIDKLDKNLNLYKSKIAELEASIKETINLLENNEELSDVELSAKLMSKIDTGKTNVEEFYSGIEMIIPVDIMNAINNGTNVINTLDDGSTWSCPNTYTNLIDYDNYIKDNRIYQGKKGNPELDDKCLMVGKQYIVDMSGRFNKFLRGDLSNWKDHGAGDRVNKILYFDTEEELCQCMYDTLLSGEQFILQVRGHSVVGTGMRTTVTKPLDLINTDNLLILDPANPELESLKASGRILEKRYINSTVGSKFVMIVSTEKHRNETAAMVGRKQGNVSKFY